MITLLHGDCREVLATLPEKSVQTVVTSPPYFGLRRYDVEGNQIGIEPTPAEYVAELVKVFREVRRVLRDDGILWLNLGDSYNANWRGGGLDTASSKQTSNRGTIAFMAHSGKSDKQLLGMPWRVAFALQEDGWVLRSDIIWHKPNPMPESVTDRPTRAHEYLFLFSKSSRYYYDGNAIAEPAQIHNGHAGTFKRENSKRAAVIPGQTVGTHRPDRNDTEQTGQRNRRSVWTVATKPYSGAHFAVFPEQLIEPCILAGSRPGDTVLDPFAGSGTTCRVAERLCRDSIGIDLGYQDLQEQRTDGVQKMMVELL